MSSRDEIDSVVPPPSAHGGDAEALARALGVAPGEILDLSATLNPLAPDIVPLVQRKAEGIHRYPESRQASIALADTIGIDVDRLLLTNGAAEAIALVATELGTASIVEPEFSLWRRHLTTVRSAGSVQNEDRVRSNPNNPTGVLAKSNERAVCWDEAFFALATGQWTRGDAECGSIVVGSLTKIFACPGLRLGYVLAPDPELVVRLRDRQPMWSVNALALGVLPELVENAPLGEWAKEIASLRGSLASLIGGAGFVVNVADAPWVLVRKAAWLRVALGHQGVLVRDCANFGLEGTVRIAVPGPSGLDRLAKALDRATAEGG